MVTIITVTESSELAGIFEALGITGPRRAVRRHRPEDFTPPPGTSVLDAPAPDVPATRRWGEPSTTVDRRESAEFEAILDAALGTVDGE